MLTHIVLLKPKAEVSQEEITTALEHVLTLQHAIPGLVSVQVGENLNGISSQGYTHGFMMQFTDAEIFKAYAPHPAHQSVSKELQQISESFIDFDMLQK